MLAESLVNNKYYNTKIMLDHNDSYCYNNHKLKGNPPSKNTKVNDMTNLQKAINAIGNEKIDLEYEINSRTCVVAETVENINGKEKVISTGLQYWNKDDLANGESESVYKNNKHKLLITLEDFNNGIDKMAS